MHIVLFIINIHVHVGNAEIVDLTSMANVSSTISTPSSVASLPPPVRRHEHVQEIEDHHTSIDPLTVELEVQDLIDRVTILEEGHQKILEMQRTILHKATQIKLLVSQARPPRFFLPAWAFLFRILKLFR